MDELTIVENNTHKVNHFNKLPDELVMKILNYLEGYEITRVNMVCCRFYRLANDTMYWKGIHGNAFLTSYIM